MGESASKQRVTPYDKTKDEGDNNLQYTTPISSETVVREASAKFCEQLFLEQIKYNHKAIKTPTQLDPPKIIVWLFWAFDNVKDLPETEKEAIHDVTKTIIEVFYEKDLLVIAEGKNGELFDLAKTEAEYQKLKKSNSRYIKVFNLKRKENQAHAVENKHTHNPVENGYNAYTGETIPKPFPNTVDLLEDTLNSNVSTQHKKASFGKMMYFFTLSFKDQQMDKKMLLEKKYSGFTVIQLQFSKGSDNAKQNEPIRFTIEPIDRNQNQGTTETEIGKEFTPSEAYERITSHIFQLISPLPGEGQDIDLSARDKEVLSLSLLWNLTFDYTKYKQRPKLYYYIFGQAVKLDKVQVVESIINSGLDLNKCFNVSALKPTEPRCILKKITMQVIKRKHFQPFVTQVNELLDNPQANQEEKEKEYINQEEKDKKGINLKEKEKEDITPIQVLFLYALTSNKFEMSKIFFAEIENPTAAALVAVGVFDKQLKGSRIMEWQAKMQTYMEFYKRMSHDIINQFHSTNKEGTYELLVQELPEWNHQNLIDIAVNTANGDFISQTPCDLLNYRIWKFGSARKADWNYFTEEGRKFPFWHFKKWIKVLLAPYILFCLNFVGFMIFLLMYSLLLISKLERNRFHWLEWILWVWIVTFLIEEIFEIGITIKRNKRDTKKKIWDILKTHFKDYFNRIDAIAIILFIVAWSVRCYAKFNPDSVLLMDASRVIFSIDFIAFSFRLLEHCYGSSFLGPLIVMISEMVTTTVKFLIILSAFFIGFAIASESVLNPEAQMNGLLPFYVFRKPFWNMFGEFFLDDLDASVDDEENICTDDPDVYNEYTTLRCPTEMGKYFVPVLMGIYYLTTNTLLFNLLIAKFNYNIADIENKSGNVWRYQYFKLNIEYSKMCILPPPFIGLTLLLILAHRWGYRGDLFIIEISRERQESLKRLEKSVLKDILKEEKQSQNVCLHCPCAKNLK